MLTPAERLLAVTADTSLRAVAVLIADKLIYYCKTEFYRYRINHDIGAPNYLACPLPFDWATKGYVGINIENKNQGHAREWLTRALLAGYTVEEVDAKRKPLLGEWKESIDNARMRAEFYRKRNSKDPDDDIPF